MFYLYIIFVFVWWDLFFSHIFLKLKINKDQSVTLKNLIKHVNFLINLILKYMKISFKIECVHDAFIQNSCKITRTNIHIFD